MKKRLLPAVLAVLIVGLWADFVGAQTSPSYLSEIIGTASAPTVPFVAGVKIPIVQPSGGTPSYLMHSMSPSDVVRLAPISNPICKTVDYTVAYEDMGGALNLCATAGTPVLTLPLKSATIFQPGWRVQICTAASTVNWTLTNLTGLTLSGLGSTTLVPGTCGTFIANTDGIHLDFFGGTAGGGGGSSNLNIGTTSIVSGANGKLLYDNAGVLGEATIGAGLSFSAGTLSATGGGATTGFGVDGGTSAQNVTGTATINNGTRLVKLASGWGTGTLTLPAIAAVSADTCIRIEDGGSFVDVSHTVTVKGGTLDGLNGGAANGTLGPFTTSGLYLVACVTGTNNWNVGPGTIATSTAPANQFANGITLNGLAYGPVTVANLSGLGTGVATALGNNLSANGGVTSTIASGATALGTSAIASPGCASVVTATATNTLTTDVVSASFNGDPTGVIGYIPATTGMLTIIAYPTTNNVNFKVCNNTGSSITPGAITLNWRVAR